MISMNFNSYARLYFSSFLFCFWKWNFIYYTSVGYVWFLLPYVNMQSNWAWKQLKLGLSIFVLSLRVCLCSRYSNLTYSPGIFANLCSLFPKFHCQLTKEKLGRSPGKGRTWYNLADGVTTLAQFYALYSHRARSFNQWQRALYPNFIINSHRARSFNQWQRALYPNFIIMIISEQVITLPFHRTLNSDLISLWEVRTCWWAERKNVTSWPWYFIPLAEWGESVRLLSNTLIFATSWCHVVFLGRM